MTFFSISGALLATSSIIMSIIMLIAGRKLINIAWFLLCVSMSLLGVSMVFLGMSISASEALYWWRFAYVGVINTPLLVLVTTYLILSKKIPLAKITLIFFIGVTLLFHVLNFRGDLIDATKLLFGEIYFDIPITHYFLWFFGYFNIIFGWIFYLLIQWYIQSRKSSNTELWKKILFFGIWIWAWSIWWYAVYMPLFGIDIYPYASILMWLYPMIVWYAIVYHHLFDARYAILQLLRFATILVASICVWVTLGWLSYRYLAYAPIIHPIETVIWILSLIFAIILYRSRWFSGLFLISSLRDLEREAEIFLEKSSVYSNSVGLLWDLEIFFANGLKIHRVVILNTDLANKYPHSTRYFDKYRKPLILSELMTADIEGESSRLITEVGSLWESIFPIEGANRAERAMLILGTKDSEKSLTEWEIRIISRIIAKIALALQILEYNKSLQEEIRMRTQALHHKNKELEWAYLKLQQVDANKDNFLAIASHELRTPMTIIKWYSDLFLKELFGPLSPDARLNMQKIYDNTDSLIELVNNILDISKIEAGRFEIIKKEIPILDTIGKCVDNFRTLYSEKGIALVLTNQATLSTLYTDESKYTLICNNILSNAYKFTPAWWSVNIEVFEESSRLYVKVTDTWDGIGADRIGHIFEKFNQADNTNYTKKSIHGTWLGLHLCKQITHLLGWGISAISRIGTGSTFTFYIPIEHDPYAI